MAKSRKLYIIALSALFLYSIFKSYLVVLNEPIATNEVELQNYASFPSVTICERPVAWDAYKNINTFEDVDDAIRNLTSRFEMKLCVRKIRGSNR